MLEDVRYILQRPHQFAADLMTEISAFKKIAHTDYGSVEYHKKIPKIPKNVFRTTIQYCVFISMKYSEILPSMIEKVKHLFQNASQGLGPSSP